MDDLPAHRSTAPRGLRVAVVGSGIAGLAAAHALRGRAEVTLYEAAEHFGGHAHTVDVELDGVRHGVDTGFLVFNERTYPGLLRLFSELEVPVAPSDMTFSVQVPRAFGDATLEWAGANLATVFCQPANTLRPRFWRMLRDLLRFNALATLLAQADEPDGELLQPLGEFLRQHRFSAEFVDWYLLPMTACIWSCPVGTMLGFPVGTLVRFCHNHGLLQLGGRPQWFTVAGGSRGYVSRIIAQLPDARRSTPVRRVQRDDLGVSVHTDGRIDRFDRVVFATHPGQALDLLDDPSPDERRVLGAIRYQPNRAVLHTDASVLPRHGAAWSAWNYEAGGPDSREVCLHYLINRLQPLPWQRPVIVSLNPLRPIAAEHVLGDYAYEHPVFDAAALQAQRQLPHLQGHRNTVYAGAWTGYGFHEDGLVSGQAAARRLLTQESLSRAEEAMA